jgi:hypothetical protein
VFSPEIREFKETRYQFERPFLLDSSDCTATFGITATPMGEGLAAVAEQGRWTAGGVAARSTRTASGSGPSPTTRAA